jgi:hypothetical protein
MSAGLVEAQGFDSAPLDLLKANFNPALPRWPAGNGRDSGRWSGGAGVDPAGVKERIARLALETSRRAVRALRPNPEVVKPFGSLEEDLPQPGKGEEAQWRELDRRIAAFEAEFTSFAKEDEDARRLTTIPAVGIMNATALIAAIGKAETFAHGRDLAAWLGLVPRRQAAADGHQQARQQVPAKAVDPWSAGGVASCRGAEHASGAMDQVATRPCYLYKSGFDPTVNVRLRHSFNGGHDRRGGLDVVKGASFARAGAAGAVHP